MHNLMYILELSRVEHIGSRTIQTLLTRWPNLSILFNLNHQERLDAGLPEKLAALITQIDLSVIDADLKWEHSDDSHHLLTWEHHAYPNLLKQIYDPPAVLYAKGDLDCLNQPIIAMVGTRQPSASGQQIARQFASQLAQ